MTRDQLERIVEDRLRRDLVPEDGRVVGDLVMWNSRSINAPRVEVNNLLNDVDAVEDCFGFGTGVNDGGALEDPTVASKLLPLIKQSRGKIAKVIALAGRLKREAANEQRKAPRFGAGEPVDVTLGDDLSDLMPVEYTNRAVEGPLWLARYVDRALLTRKRRDEEPSKTGPVVMCVDCSGSMSGDRYAWAMATT